MTLRLLSIRHCCSAFTNHQQSHFYSSYWLHLTIHCLRLSRGPSRPTGATTTTLTMPAEDITSVFRTTLSSAQQALPPSRSKSPFRASSPGPSRRRGHKHPSSSSDDEEFLKEAYRIVCPHSLSPSHRVAFPHPYIYSYPFAL